MAAGSLDALKLDLDLREAGSEDKAAAPRLRDADEEVPVAAAVAAEGEAADTVSEASIGSSFGSKLAEAWSSGSVLMISMSKVNISSHDNKVDSTGCCTCAGSSPVGCGGFSNTVVATFSSLMDGSAGLWGAGEGASSCMTSLAGTAGLVMLAGTKTGTGSGGGDGGSGREERGRRG